VKLRESFANAFVVKHRHHLLVLLLACINTIIVGGNRTPQKHKVKLILENNRYQNT